METQLAQAGPEVRYVAKDDRELIPQLLPPDCWRWGSRHAPTMPGLCGAEDWTQDLVCARQTLHQQSYIPSPAPGSPL